MTWQEFLSNPYYKDSLTDPNGYWTRGFWDWVNDGWSSYLQWLIKNGDSGEAFNPESRVDWFNQYVKGHYGDMDYSSFFNWIFGGGSYDDYYNKVSSGDNNSGISDDLSYPDNDSSGGSSNDNPDIGAGGSDSSGGIGGLPSEDDSFMNWLNDLLSRITNQTNFLNNPMNFLRDFNSLLKDFVGMIGRTNSSGWEDVSWSDIRNIVNQFYSNYYNFTTQLFTAAYNQAIWRQQQQYNSPYEQVKRLAEAGINPMYSNAVTNGNAESSAGGIDIQSAQPYQDVGSALALQEKQMEQDKIFRGLSLGLSAISSGVSGYAAIGNFMNAKQLLPYQQSLLVSQAASQSADASYKQVAAQLLPLSVIGDFLNNSERISNDLEVAKRGQDFNMILGIMSNDTQIYGIDTNAQTQRDVAAGNNATSLEVANINASSARYSVDKQYDQAMKLLQTGQINKFIDWFESESTILERETYVDSSTGQQVGVDLSTSADFIAAAAKADVNGKFTHQGKNYSKDKVRDRYFNSSKLSMLKAGFSFLMQSTSNGSKEQDEQYLRLSDMLSKSLNVANHFAPSIIARDNADSLKSSFMKYLQPIMNQLPQ